jgi:hypothetical protein
VKYDWGERGLSFEFRGPAGEIVQTELA